MKPSVLDNNIFTFICCIWSDSYNCNQDECRKKKLKLVAGLCLGLRDQIRNMKLYSIGGTCLIHVKNIMT